MVEVEVMVAVVGMEVAKPEAETATHPYVTRLRWNLHSRIKHDGDGDGVVEEAETNLTEKRIRPRCFRQGFQVLLGAVLFLAYAVEVGK
jgi:hypothetical protein